VGSAAGAAPADDLRLHIDSGDTAWQRRADGHIEGRARPQQIGQAIAEYEAALALAPENLEARWKLMRALFFLGEHVVSETQIRIDIFERGRQLGEEGMDQVATEVGGRDRMLDLSAVQLKAKIADPTAAAEIYFWSAVQTGLWGRTRGKLASARQGVATKIRDYASISIALDPTVEHGGGHRILGRLHTEAPKIPFITGWIDRAVAIAELETCSRISPEDLTTKLYLAEALIEFAPKRKEEGLEMLRMLIASETDPLWLVEELKAQDDARALLEPFAD